MLKEISATQQSTRVIRLLPMGALKKPLVVTDDGSIYQLDGTSKHCFKNDRGYVMTTVTFQNGTSLSIAVHRLVIWSFKGQWSDFGQQTAVDHIDGNKSNNRLANLQLIPLGRNVSKFFHTEAQQKYASLQRYDTHRIALGLVPLKLPSGTVTHSYFISPLGNVYNRTGHLMKAKQTTKYKSLKQIALTVDRHSFQPSLGRLMIINFARVPSSWTSWRVLQKDKSKGFDINNLYCYPVNIRKGNN